MCFAVVCCKVGMNYVDGGERVLLICTEMRRRNIESGGQRST